MKKTTLIILFLMVSLSYSQTNTTGQVQLSTTTGLEMGVQIDVTSSEVNISIAGPADRWLAVGFGATDMDAGNDVVIFDGTNLTDRTFIGQGSWPSMDANQDWVVTNIDLTTVPGYVGVEATRPISTLDASDYDFNLIDTSINLVWARSNGAPGSGTFSSGYHGGGNRGALVTGLTLGIDEFALSNFKITPNPVSTDFEIELPANISNANVEVYDVLGKLIHKDKISEFNATINSSNWNSGVYILRLSSGNTSQTKRLIKQ